MIYSNHYRFHCPYPECKRVSGAEKERILDRQRETLKPARVAAGLTQRQLGNMVGVAEATISSWERGKTVANWCSLCYVLPELEEYISK